MNVLNASPFGPSSNYSPVPYPNELLGDYRTYQDLKTTISNYLKGLAKVGSKCSFRELYTALNIPLNVTWSYHRKLISQICHEINEQEYLAGRPLIGVLLCAESDGYITGKGFFDLMDYPQFCEGFALDKNNKTHCAMFFGIHARKCWLYWHKQRKEDEKRAADIQRNQTQNRS